ncbi:MAG: hypothetical protein NTX22_09615 [Ignavibacteriales bacterium]|nr:hypothetical protein [Ignavibacteriales bacterium]
MQNKSSQSIIKLIIVLIGFAYLLKLIGAIRISNTGFFSYAFLVYGIVSVYFSFNTNRKGFLFFNTSAFMVGVLLFVLENYTIKFPAPLILPAIIFVLGSCFLILYLDNYSNVIILYCSLTLLFFAVFIIYLSKNYTVRGSLSTLGNLFLEYYPVLIILTGVIGLLNRKNTSIK